MATTADGAHILEKLSRRPVRGTLYKFEDERLYLNAATKVKYVISEDERWWCLSSDRMTRRLSPNELSSITFFLKARVARGLSMVHTRCGKGLVPER
jgi:hypothetical protein